MRGRSRRVSRRPSRLQAVVVLLGAAVGLGGGMDLAIGSPGGSTGARSLAQTPPPFWCQWIPDPWKPPECFPSTTTTTAPPGTTTTTAPPGSTTTTTPPIGDVEDHFAAPGPSPVTSGAAGDGYTVFHPTDLATDGIDNPILTWGNGTWSTPNDYTDTLRHLASWGFVVIATNSGGFHDQMRAAADYMVSQDRTATSVFFQQLDTTKVAAFGHSQGAGAALTLMGTSLNDDGLFKSALPVNLPDRIFGAPGGPTIDFSRIVQPFFLVTGANDFLTSASEQQFFFDQVRGPAAKAAVVGGDHNVIQRTDNQMQGYITAWFKYTLQGDTFARRAFVGSPPQINANPAWTWQQLKNLP